MVELLLWKRAKVLKLVVKQPFSFALFQPLLFSSASQAYSPLPQSSFDELKLPIMVTQPIFWWLHFSILCSNYGFFGVTDTSVDLLNWKCSNPQHKYTNTHKIVHTFSLCFPLSLNTVTFSWVKYFTLKKNNSFPAISPRCYDNLRGMISYCLTFFLNVHFVLVSLGTKTHLKN